MRTKTLRRKNSKKVNLYVKNFYKFYLEDNVAKFYPSELDSKHVHTYKDRKVKLSKKKYCLILKTFFKIYFKDLFLKNKQQYFFLGGILSLVKIPKKVRVVSPYMNHNSFKDNIGLFWWMLPTERYRYMVRLYKLMGKTSNIRKLEQEAIDNEILNKLTNFKIFKQERIKNKNFTDPCFQK